MGSTPLATLWFVLSQNGCKSPDFGHVLYVFSIMVREHCQGSARVPGGMKAGPSMFSGSQMKDKPLVVLLSLQRGRAVGAVLTLVGSLPSWLQHARQVGKATQIQSWFYCCYCNHDYYRYQKSDKASDLQHPRC